MGERRQIQQILIDLLAALQIRGCTIVTTGSQNGVGCELEIKLHLLQKCIHQRNQLNDELVLPQVVTALEDDLREQRQPTTPEYDGKSGIP